MATLPQLLAEDLQQLDDALQELLTRSEATTALIADKGGFLITHRGDGRQFDLTTIAALAAGAYMANQTIAGLVHESRFNSIYQQGDHFSLFVMGVDEPCLLVVIFPAHHSVGAVKYYAGLATPHLAEQLKRARARAPEAGVDLAVLNLADTSGIFRKKA